MSSKPKILAFDVETSPLLVWTFGIGEQHLGIEQIHTDWGILAFAAKWVGTQNMLYMDRRDGRKEKPLIKALWDLLDEADVVLTQNGKHFDCKKANAKFIEYKMKPPAPYKHIDTLQIARKVAGFTSNKLAYVSDRYCDIKKSSHEKFPGLKLWLECMKGNKEAWKEMEAYNKQDVDSTIDWYEKLAAWDTTVDLSSSGDCRVCNGCNLQSRGFSITNGGKYQRFQCQDCGAWQKSSTNLLTSDDKRLKLRSV